MGEVCSHRDKEFLDEVNKRVALNEEDEAEIIAHDDVFLIAPKNEDCEKINQRKIDQKCPADWLLCHACWTFANLVLSRLSGIAILTIMANSTNGSPTVRSAPFFLHWDGGVSFI